MKPEEFWRLSYWEFVLYLEGYRRRNVNQLELAAWMTSHLMNAHGPKQRVTPDRLLGRKQKKRDDEVDERSIKREGEKLRLQHAKAVEKIK